MSPHTAFLSKLVGLYCILIAICMTVRWQSTLETVISLLHDAPLMLVLGVVTVVAGLAMVLAHNLWSGGARTVVITLIGWVALIKGLLFLLLPPDAEAEFFLRRLHYQRFFYLDMAFLFVIGVWLTYGGFRATARSQGSRG